MVPDLPEGDFTVGNDGQLLKLVSSILLMKTPLCFFAV